MAPRYNRPYSELCTLILKHPQGTPYSELLGSHAEDLLEYDGAMWRIRPRLVDQPACDAAREAAFAQGKGWYPESEESFRTGVGEPYCSHSDPMEFVRLLKETKGSPYYIDSGADLPTKQSTSPGIKFSIVVLLIAGPLIVIGVPILTAAILQGFEIIDCALRRGALIHCI